MCIRDRYFFKQKTAYEILSGLVGSEMCIRDRFKGRMKVKQSDDGQYYDVRILKHTDEAGVNKIIDKQKKEREHRRRKRMEEHKRKVEARNSCNK